MYGLKIKNNGGNTMPRDAKSDKPIVVSLVASQHIDEIYNWYENRQIGLGKRFLSALTTTFQKIQRTPAGYQITHEPHRRVIIEKFPYGVFYEEQDKQIIISAVLHTARDPDTWQNLLE
jgi:plasmid stabilization system protein ParE